MEKIFIAANALSAGSTRFSVVRYGNVVGSRGSVIPLFKKLIAEGKPLTITDKRMTRFWITLDQSVDLVFLCHEKMIGREIFVPKIPSMKMVDLARAMSGNEFWIETGIRPGEKIHECLITEDEAPKTLDANNYYVIFPTAKKVSYCAPEGFRYTSDGNDDWLSVEQLKDMIK
jgi:UDP-N-acetylglucosamine 4,6-dehydratase